MVRAHASLDSLPSISSSSPSNVGSSPSESGVYDLKAYGRGPAGGISPASAASDKFSTEVTLSEEVFSALVRRRGRRLHDLQATHHVSLRLDRARLILHVTAKEQGSLDAVLAQLACLGAPRLAVSGAVWSELMRTRLQREGSPDALLLRLQKESGCRIHIERHKQEVRIFGTPAAIELATKLLEQLHAEVTEKAVPTDFGSVPNAVALQTVAHNCAVTLHVDEGQVKVLGMSAAVDRAVAELQQIEFFQDPQPPPPPAAAPPIIAAVPMPSTQMMASPAAQAQEAHGVAGPAQGSTSPAQAWIQVPVPLAWMAPQQLPLQGQPGGDAGLAQSPCPTCGACVYCTSCGAPTAGCWVGEEGASARRAVVLNRAPMGFLPGSPTSPPMPGTGDICLVPAGPMVAPCMGQDGSSGQILIPRTVASGGPQGATWYMPVVDGNYSPGATVAAY